MQVIQEEAPSAKDSVLNLMAAETEKIQSCFLRPSGFIPRLARIRDSESRSLDEEQTISSHLFVEWKTAESTKDGRKSRCLICL